MNIMRFKVWYFIFSFLIILPGLYYLFSSGLKLGIDFTGGALLEYRFENKVIVDDLKMLMEENEIEVGQITSAENNTFIIKAKPIEQEKLSVLKEKLTERFGASEERRIENVGPIIGAELSKKALLALGFSSLAIVLYIWFSFRKVPKPASSFRFGIAAIVALLHDV